MEEIPGSEKFFPAQLVFLALGFLGPQQELIKAMDVKVDGRSNVQTPPKVGLFLPLLYYATGHSDNLAVFIEIFHQPARCICRW